MHVFKLHRLNSTQRDCVDPNESRADPGCLQDPAICFNALPSDGRRSHAEEVDGCVLSHQSKAHSNREIKAVLLGKIIPSFKRKKGKIQLMFKAME